jgi:hypothetical protein
MDPKLKAFLVSKGISEDTIAKLERGDAPDDAEQRLRKIAPDSPVLVKISECRALLDKIQADVAAIKKADAQYPRPILAAQTNGFKHEVLDLPNFLSKGQRP